MYSAFQKYSHLLTFSILCYSQNLKIDSIEIVSLAYTIPHNV
jgi:hypothetical protein